MQLPWMFPMKTVPSFSAGKPVVSVNRGCTRGDELADVRVDAGCSQTLAAILAALEPGRTLAGSTGRAFTPH